MSLGKSQGKSARKPARKPAGKNAWKAVARKQRKPEAKTEDLREVGSASESAPTSVIQTAGHPQPSGVKADGLAAFAELGLGGLSLRALAELGFSTPTPIQSQSIPPLMKGADLIGQAQTGTGKTAAFALPMLERIDPDLGAVQGLILAPTREIALQICEAMHHFSKFQPRIRFTPVYGGQPIVPQMKKISRGSQIVVGTPGRIIDLMKRGVLKLDRLRTLVLDEADEMLRMGFIEDIDWILSQSPAGRQLALFSATMPNEIKRIADRYLNKPVHIQVARNKLALPNIAQSYILVRASEKRDALVRVLESQSIEAGLIFVRTKVDCSELANHLTSRGIVSEPLNGDMSQTARELVVRRIKAGKLKLVVATDVAARGLDIDRISHVINYDMPGEVESYVHRIGRTGRAGSDGSTILFVTPRERAMLLKIERFMKSKISHMALPSHQDVIADRKRRLADALRVELACADLGVYREVVEALAEECGGDLAAIAAAAARLASSDTPLDAPVSEFSSAVRHLSPKEAGEEKRASRRPKNFSRQANGKSKKFHAKGSKPRGRKPNTTRRGAEPGSGGSRVRTSR